MFLAHLKQWISQWLQWPLAFFLSAFCIALVARSLPASPEERAHLASVAVSDSIEATAERVTMTPQGQYVIASGVGVPCLKGTNEKSWIGRGDTIRSSNIYLDMRTPDCLRTDNFSVTRRGASGAILETVLPLWGSYAAGFIAAITLGDRGLLPVDLKQNFQQQGLLHLVAVSGLHFALVATVLWLLLRLVPLVMGPRRNAIQVYRLRVTLLVALLAPYAYVAGMAGSVLRAFVLFSSLALLTATTMRRYDPLALLSWFGIGMLLLAPAAFFSLGMQLSFWITLALVWAARASAEARHHLKTNADPAHSARLRAVLWGWVAVVPTVAANLVLGIYGVDSNWSGILNNIIAIPVFGLLVLPSAWIALLAAQLGLPGLSLYPADFCLWCVDWIVDLGWDQAPFSIPVWQSVFWLVVSLVTYTSIVFSVQYRASTVQ